MKTTWRLRAWQPADRQAARLLHMVPERVLPRIYAAADPLTDGGSERVCYVIGADACGVRKGRGVAHPSLCTVRGALCTACHQPSSNRHACLTVGHEEGQEDGANKDPGELPAAAVGGQWMPMGSTEGPGTIRLVRPVARAMAAGHAMPCLGLGVRSSPKRCGLSCSRVDHCSCRFKAPPLMSGTPWSSDQPGRTCAIKANGRGCGRWHRCAKNANW